MRLSTRPHFVLPLESLVALTALKENPALLSSPSSKDLLSGFNPITSYCQKISSSDANGLLLYTQSIKNLLLEIRQDPVLLESQKLGKHLQFLADFSNSRIANKQKQGLEVPTRESKANERIKENFYQHDQTPNQQIKEILKIKVSQMPTLASLGLEEFPSEHSTRIMEINTSLKAISGGDYINFSKLAERYIKQYEDIFKIHSSPENYEELAALTNVIKENLLDLEDRRNQDKIQNGIYWVSWQDRRMKGLPNEHSTLLIKYSDQDGDNIHVIKPNFFNRTEQLNPNAAMKIMRYLVRAAAGLDLALQKARVVSESSYPFEKSLQGLPNQPYGNLNVNIGPFNSESNIKLFFKQNAGVTRHLIGSISSEQELELILENIRKTSEKISSDKTPFNGLTRNCHTLTANIVRGLIDPAHNDDITPFKPLGANALGSETKL